MFERLRLTVSLYKTECIYIVRTFIYSLSKQVFGLYALAAP